MHIYTENSKKCFTICNKRILRDTNINNIINEGENKYFCSNHVKGKDNSSRKRKYKDPNIKYCCKNNKIGNQCGNSAILVGNICKEHWKKENGYKKHDKVLIPDHLYIKNNSINFEANYWYEYRKYIEDNDNYTTYIENKKDGYYEKIISNFNKSENLFIKYLNPGHLVRKIKNKEEIISSLNIQNNKKQELNLKRKEIFNYENRIKKRKINYENIKGNPLKYNFSFKYSITDYYIESINKSNKKLLNKVLICIIDIRNLLHVNKYIDKDIYNNIIIISDKILEII